MDSNFHFNSDSDFDHEPNTSENLAIPIRFQAIPIFIPILISVANQTPLKGVFGWEERGSEIRIGIGDSHSNHLIGRSPILIPISG